MRKLGTYGVLATLFICLAFLVFPAAAGTVKVEVGTGTAAVTALTGKALVVRVGTTQRVRVAPGELLAAGDQVTTGYFLAQMKEMGISKIGVVVGNTGFGKAGKSSKPGCPVR